MAAWQPTINPPCVDLESPPRAGRPVLYLVVHTAETGEYDGADVAVAGYLARAHEASIHAAIDNNSITPSVPEDRVAWAASNPKINNFALQAEWVGRADQGSAGWDDQFSRDQMRVGAWLYAKWATKYGIPVRHGSVQDLRDGKPGFYGHVDSTRAWNNPDGHYDPGPTFPWDRFLALVREFQGTATEGDWLDMASEADVRKIVHDEVKALLDAGTGRSVLAERNDSKGIWHVYELYLGAGHAKHLGPSGFAAANAVHVPSIGRLDATNGVWDRFEPMGGSWAES